jgi:hypothetical protein
MHAHSGLHWIHWQAVFDPDDLDDEYMNYGGG